MKRKRKFALEENEVNVVPLMDILTTMLFFLILMASSANFSTIIAISDMLSAPSNEKEKPKFDMVISVKNIKRAEVLLSDVSKLKVINKGSFQSYLGKKFRKSPYGHRAVIFGKNPKDLVKKLQPYLVRIKQAFPHEIKATLALSDKINYQDMIHFIESTSTIPETDESFKVENLLGHVRMSKVLFPEVALQELGGP